MAFEDAFPLFHQGPLSDLTFAYVHADIGASGAPTVAASATSRGFNITRTNTGIYSLTFPKCKFCLPLGDVRPDDITDITDARKVNVAKNIDATSGAVVFHTCSVDGTEDDAEDPVSGSEIVFLVLLGF